MTRELSQDELESELSQLAVRFRGGEPVGRQYGACLTKLFHIPGYSGEPDADSLLPIEFMPQIYRDFWNKKGTQ